MKLYNNTIIIGIDHGYGNIKTATQIFSSGIIQNDTKPFYEKNLLIYDGKYYSIGEGHKEFLADKFLDSDYYVLTLAAIASELRSRNITNANVHIAAGLPLTWLGGQAKAFKEYLFQKKTVDFTFNRKDYHINIVGVDVFPQGFSAIADKLYMFKGTNMIADIGNGTMNIMYVNDQKPDIKNCFTEKFGTNQCTIQIKERVMQVHHTTIPDSIITQVMRFGTADISKDYLQTITDTAREYVGEIFQRLRTHEYNPQMMKLYVVGGGGCLIKNFATYDNSRVIIISDIHANAKGYEYLAELNIRKGGGKK